jgi:hypothetical protein
MLSSILKSQCDAGYGGDTEYEADLGREMVADLKRFLGAALAEKIEEKSQYRWPLRYNSAAEIATADGSEE